MSTDLQTYINWTALESILSVTFLAFAAFYASALSHGIQLSAWMKKQGHSKKVAHGSRSRGRRSTISHVSPPSEMVIKRAEVTNKKNGHENLGFLSLEAGFSPIDQPLTALPGQFAAWDELASELPQLIKTQTVRKTVNNLPFLDGSKPNLPDRYLQRAATILGLAAHVYVRLEGDIPLTLKVKSHAEILPECLFVPWTQVCKRLGRSDAFLTYIDLVLYNFKTEATALEQMELENSKLMIPTVNNKEEQTFYGVMIEINAKAVPVMRNVVEAQRSVLANNTAKLKTVIRDLTTQLRRITKVTLAKLSASQSKKSCIDPVIWTETVANLAIPWLTGVTGSAGTAHPFFHMMDEFTGRDHYGTRIGAEALKVRENFPPHWQEFLTAIREVSVSNFVATTQDSELQGLWDDFKHMYVGDEGLLGFHRRKVFGFLSVSFRIGRNSTINGLGKRQNRQQWEEADDELENSRVERPGSDEAQVKPAVMLDLKNTKYAVQELIQHNSREKGFWFAAQGKVYDATPFLTAHPGGERVISLVSGQDATKDLSAVAHLTNPKTKHLLERHQIGKIRYQRFTSSAVSNAYNEFVEFSYKVAEIEATYKAMTSFLYKQTTSADLPEELNAHRARHLLVSRKQLHETYTPTLALYLDQAIKMLNQAGGKCKEESSKVVSELKLQAENKSPINLDIENLPSWANAVSSVQQNCDIIGQIKANCTQALATFDEVDSSTTDLSEDVCHNLTCITESVVSQTAQLGN